MDIRPTGPEKNSEVHHGIRKDSAAKAKTRADDSHSHAPRSRAPELSNYLQRAKPFQEVRPEVVQQAKERVANNTYVSKSTAERTAAAILLAS